MLHSFNSHHMSRFAFHRHTRPLFQSIFFPSFILTLDQIALLQLTAVNAKTVSIISQALHEWACMQDLLGALELSPSFPLPPKLFLFLPGTIRPLKHPTKTKSQSVLTPFIEIYSKLNPRRMVGNKAQSQHLGRRRSDGLAR